MSFVSESNTLRPVAQSRNYCRVAIVGSSGRREFRELVKWLCEHEQIRVTDEFPDLESALQSDRLSETHLTVVLQSFSDQYAGPVIDQLIGHTLFQRLLCCYGPWCESDGRTRTLWPDAVRVPVRLAQSVIELELPGVGAKADPIPPTSARDEIFAHRLIDSSDDTASELSDLNAAVIGPDRIVRQTVSMTLKALGVRTVITPLISVDARTPVRPQQTSRGPIHVVIHDLDPWSKVVQESLEATRQAFPDALILGLATMPDAGLTYEISYEKLDGVVPKLDMQHGLEWKLRQVLRPSAL